MRMRAGLASAIVLSLMALAMLAPCIQAKAEYDAVSRTINIWKNTNGVPDSCSTLMADVPSRVMPCTSPFASTCISVDAHLNITRGGDLNWTGFHVEGCEIRMNESSDGRNRIYSFGNLTVLKSNITSNTSTYKSLFYVYRDSNFTMADSFVSRMGYNNNVGFIIYTPIFDFMNNTISRSYGGMKLSSDYMAPDYVDIGNANGSVVSNFTVLSTSGVSGFTVEYASNVTAYDFRVSGGTGYGVRLFESNNNNISGFTASSNTDANLRVDSGSNNRFNDFFLNKSNFYAIMAAGENNTFSNFLIHDCYTALTYLLGCIRVDAKSSFIKGVVNLTDKYFAYIYSSEFLFQDIIFFNETGHAVIAFSSGSNPPNPKFINVSYIGSVTEFFSSEYPNITRQWYTDVRVVDSNTGLPISGANVTFRNVTQDLVNYSYTNSTGWAYRLNLTQYINKSVATIQQQPYNVSAFAAGYYPNSSNQAENTIALTDNAVVVLALDPLPAAPTCSDGIKNQDETDVDCGGTVCSSCANGKVCAQNSDCQSGNCASGTCAAAPGGGEPAPPSGGSTPGFEAGILALIASSMFAFLFLRKAGTMR